MPFDPAPRIKSLEGEAIRQGCLIAPRQCYGQLFKVGSDGVLEACAAGAYLLGIGYPEAMARAMRHGTEVKALDDNPGAGRVHGIVWPLNDGCGGKKVSREEIAAMFDSGGIRCGY